MPWYCVQIRSSLSRHPESSLPEFDIFHPSFSFSFLLNLLLFALLSACYSSFSPAFSQFCFHFTCFSFPISPRSVLNSHPCPVSLIPYPPLSFEFCSLFSFFSSLLFFQCVWFSCFSIFYFPSVLFTLHFLLFFPFFSWCADFSSSPSFPRPLSPPSHSSKAARFILSPLKYTCTQPRLSHRFRIPLSSNDNDSTFIK